MKNHQIRNRVLTIHLYFKVMTIKKVKKKKKSRWKEGEKVKVWKEIPSSSPFLHCDTSTVAAVATWPRGSSGFTLSLPLTSRERQKRRERKEEKKEEKQKGKGQKMCWFFQHQPHTKKDPGFFRKEILLFFVLSFRSSFFCLPGVTHLTFFLLSSALKWRMIVMIMIRWWG